MFKLWLFCVQDVGSVVRTYVLIKFSVLLSMVYASTDSDMWFDLSWFVSIGADDEFIVLLRDLSVQCG